MDPALKIGTVIYSSLLAGEFFGLVVLDEGNRPLGVFERSMFLDLLRIPFALYATLEADRSRAADNGLVRAMIQQTELWVILSAPSVRAEAEGKKAFVPERTNQLEALVMMTDKEWDVAAVTDVLGRYKGLISRRRLLDNIVLGALRAPDRNAAESRKSP